MSYKDRVQGSSDRKSLIVNLLRLATGGTVVAALLILLAMMQSGARFFEGVRLMFNVPAPKPQVDVRSVIVQKIRPASQLTTAIFAMEAVVPTSQDSTVGGWVVGKTSLLYIAYGEVRAGVDLAKLTPENVEVINDTIRLRLPPPHLLDSKIDVERSQVYLYDRGLLGLGPDVGPQLQTLAEQKALQKIVAAACSQGLLTQANDRAKLVVSQLISTAGYKEVVVETQMPTEKACTQG